MAVAQWLEYLLFESYTPGSSRVGHNFIFHKISWLEGHWNVPAIQSTEWSLNGGWNATEIHLFRHHSVAIQPPSSHHSIDWKVRFHPVFVISVIAINVFYCISFSTIHNVVDDADPTSLKNVRYCLLLRGENEEIKKNKVVNTKILCGILLSLNVNRVLFIRSVKHQYIYVRINLND